MRRSMYDASWRDGWSAETVQRTSVTHEPHVAERIEKVALTVNAPRRIVISHVVETPLRARGERTRHERVRVTAEDLDSHGRGAQDRGALPSVCFGLADEKRRARELEPCDRSQAPQHRSAEGPLVPGDGRRCVGDGEHDGNDGRG